MDIQTALSLAVLALTTPGSLAAQNWQEGPKASRKDLVPTAVSNGQLASGTTLIADQIQAFMACTGDGSGKRTFELRFITQRFAGYAPAIPLVPTRVSIDGDEHPAQTQTFLLQNQAFFVAEPDAATVKKIAGIGVNRSATLVFDFISSGRKFSFITTIGHPNAPVAAVLDACGVESAPARPATPVTSTAMVVSPDSGRYSVYGINLGMTESQVLAALKKIGGPDRFSASQGGYKAAKTPNVSFDTFQFNDAGRLSSMHVTAPNSKHLKESKSSGPTYDLAVKLFGPPESLTNNGAFWGQENSGKSFAEYQLGDPGEPSDLWVCDGKVNP